MRFLARRAGAVDRAVVDRQVQVAVRHGERVGRVGTQHLPAVRVERGAVELVRADRSRRALVERPRDADLDRGRRLAARRVRHRHRRRVVARRRVGVGRVCSVDVSSSCRGRRSPTRRSAASPSASGRRGVEGARPAAPRPWWASAVAVTSRRRGDRGALAGELEPVQVHQRAGRASGCGTRGTGGACPSGTVSGRSTVTFFHVCQPPVGVITGVVRNAGLVGSSSRSSIVPPAPAGGDAEGDRVEVLEVVRVERDPVAVLDEGRGVAAADVGRGLVDDARVAGRRLPGGAARGGPELGLLELGLQDRLVLAGDALARAVAVVRVGGGDRP